MLYKQIKSENKGSPPKAKKSVKLKFLSIPKLPVDSIYNQSMKKPFYAKQGTVPKASADSFIQSKEKYSVQNYGDMPEYFRGKQVKGKSQQVDMTREEEERNF